MRLKKKKKNGVFIKQNTKHKKQQCGCVHIGQNKHELNSEEKKNSETGGLLLYISSLLSEASPLMGFSVLS